MKKFPFKTQMEAMDLQIFKLPQHIQKVQDLEMFSMEVVEPEVEVEAMVLEVVESKVEVVILLRDMGNIFRIIKKILLLVI